jgi:hypothetical protein
MRLSIGAAVALLLAASAKGQTMPDLTTVAPVGGNWTYAGTADGNEAVFANAYGYSQLWIRCFRATRQISISRSASAAAPLLDIWTSSASRGVAASFTSTTARLTVMLTNYDPLLDAIATSRGRLGFRVGNDPALVVPAWPEVARVIEDCRS